jgi:tetratricopeptide (TPR) repeat protein
VLGTAGWDDALLALGVADATTALEQLCAAEIIFAQDQSRFTGTREFWFKHALVRDVAYSSVSQTLKVELHARAGAWLARAGEDAATVAEHYDLGHEQGMAAGFWERAARRALAANALTAAVEMADRALTYATEPRTGFTRALLLDEIYSRLDERASQRSEAIEAMVEHAYDEASEVLTLGAAARYDHARSAGNDVEQRLTDAAERSARLGLIDEQARCAATLAARYAFAGELAHAEEAAEQLLELARQRGLPPAAVDAWQTLAVVRQTRGELAAALEARRHAARAARTAGLRDREAMLTINLGFALTTIGAKDEARQEIDAGVIMAEEIGSTGTVRLGHMILLGWAAHFGADPSLARTLEDARQTADEAALGGWITKDRVTLGVLFYRGCELVALGEQADLERASKLLAIAAEAYRQTDNRDVLPVALGYWAEALRRLGDTEQAERIALEAAELVEAGAPSLLNEGIIYLALAGARVDLGDLTGAQETIHRAMPTLCRRVQGLRGTSYEKQFLTALPHNAGLLAAAEAYACVPDELAKILRAC